MSIREATAIDIALVLGDIQEPRPVLVTREPFDPERLAITQFPAILITSLNEEKETITMGAMGSTGLGRRTGTIEYEIRAYVRGTNLDTQRNDIIEAIEEALDQDRSRLQSSSVTDSQVTRIEIQSRLPPLAEAVITYQVKYFHKRAIT